jgi:hypothetical protein
LSIKLIKRYQNNIFADDINYDYLYLLNSNSFGDGDREISRRKKEGGSNVIMPKDRE